MAKQLLNSKLLTKMAVKLKKKEQYLREQISRKASKNSISSLAAQILWAKDMGIATGLVLRSVDQVVREEVQNSGKVNGAIIKVKGVDRKVGTQKKNGQDVAAVIDFVLEDAELRGRCRDLLLARKHYDRVVREATTVFDDRIKKISGIANMNPSALVGKAINPDPSKAVIVVSTENNEQQGFHSICNGVMLAFRNRAHHTLSNSFTQAEALKFCGFVDTLLTVIGKATIHPERV